MLFNNTAYLPVKSRDSRISNAYTENQEINILIFLTMSENGKANRQKNKKRIILL